MKLRLGELVLIRMAFHQQAGAKVRPAVVILDTDDTDFVAAPITSQARAAEFDFAIREWRVAGLNVESFVRVHKLTVLPKHDIARRLGKLAGSDLDELKRILAQAFCDTSA